MLAVIPAVHLAASPGSGNSIYPRIMDDGGNGKPILERIRRSMYASVELVDCGQSLTGKNTKATT